MATLRSPISLLFLFSLLSLIIILLLISKTGIFTIPNPNPKLSSRHPHLKVRVFPLPQSFNYHLLRHYWSLSSPDSRIHSDPDSHLRPRIQSSSPSRPPYPSNPLINQYSAEYWLFGDLETPESERSDLSVARRVGDGVEEYDVVFVPFFATLSAELELGWGDKGAFLKKDAVLNGDYKRQKEVVEMVRGSEGWKRTGGRDHVFVLTDPVAMWHVKKEIAPAILLVVDFGGWYKLDSKSSSDGNSSHMIQHTQVSLLKDVIVPYTYLLPRLQLSENHHRHTLLYFKGAKHRHRGGLVREKLMDLLVNEPNVIMEEGFPNTTGREQSIKGMRNSEFCLHPAGDTPTSCRLFDAVISLCIPVIVSDEIELPFEGMIDYSDFSVFVSVSNALQPGWLVEYLKGFSKQQKDTFRENMARVQPNFQYDNGRPGGIGPIPPDGAVNYIWRKVHQKLPMIKEAITRDKRKPGGVSIPLRCHCT